MKTNKKVIPYYLLLIYFLILPGICNSQKFAINPFAGYNYNHSNRAEYRLGELNDNYNFSPVYGINIKYIRETISYNIGFNTFNLVNEFNLRGDLRFLLSSYKNITKFRTYNYCFGIENSLFKKNNYTLSMESGIDYSRAIFNNFPLYSENVDSIFYRANKSKITTREYLIYLKENSLGVFFSLVNEFKLNEFLSLNLKISARFGITPKFQSIIEYEEEDGNNHPAPSAAYILNKGDFFGCNLGLIYYLNFDK